METDISISPWRESIRGPQSAGCAMGPWWRADSSWPQDGFLPTHDQVVTGQMPDEDGVWMDIRAMHFGQAVAAGDFDNDGLCDLVASSLSWINQNQGHVFLYRGRRAWACPDPGGVHAQPSMWLTSLLADHS